MGIFAAFQLRNEAFVLFMRELSNLVFEDGLCCFARRGVKEHNRRHIFPKWLRYAGHLLGQNPHAEADVALKPRATNWLVKPFTSFKAAQSSRMMSLLVFSKWKLAITRKASTSCCWQLITKMRCSLSTK